MNAPKRILVIKLSSFGDLFHALPAVNNLKMGLDASIDWVTQPEYVDLVKCFSVVDKVIPFPRRQFWSRALALVMAVRAKHYDYVIDLQGLLKSALVARIARGGLKIGPSFQREGTRYFYDVIAGPCNKHRHAVDENLDVVRYLGVSVIPVEFPVMFPDQVVEQPRPRIGLVPSSRHANKNWPVAKFTEAASQLGKEFGAALYLFGSSADRAICEKIRAELADRYSIAGVQNLAGRTSLVEMGSWFKQMDLVIANDSGPLHMAVAVGTPVVTMFGPTDPVRTGPFGQRQAVCTTEVACRPCFAKVCKLPSVQCMDGISVQQVVESAGKMLRRSQ